MEVDATKRITVDLPEGLWERIRERAQANELTVGEVVRDSLRDSFEVNEEDKQEEQGEEEEDEDEEQDEDD